MGRGLCFNKYTGSRGKGGSNDADAEYVALIRDIMDEAGVDFQTCELGRVNAGGGGTIAYIMAKYGMNVIDSGVAVLSMHALWEVANKADIYEAYRGYKASSSAPNQPFVSCGEIRTKLAHKRPKQTVFHRNFLLAEESPCCRSSFRPPSRCARPKMLLKSWASHPLCARRLASTAHC